MQTLWQDLRYGARMLFKNPGGAMIAVFTLALGIGANAAIFSVVNGVLLRPLPYSEPQQLVRLFETVDRATMANDRMEVAPANFHDWREPARSFSRLAAFGLTWSVINNDGEAERLDGALVTSDFFATMGVAPARGRAFTTEDEQAGERRVVIGFDLWQRRFGGADDIVGRAIQLDGFSFTVIGVAPPGFQYPRHTQVYELYRLNANQRQMREAHFLKVVARLKPGVTVAQAQSEMTAMARRLAEQYPQTNRNWGANVVPLREVEVGRVRPELMALLGAVGLALLVACSNVASLLLARSIARQTEIGVRLALGASAWRIARQLLTESLMLAALGAVAGLLLGEWALEALLALAPESLPRLGEVRLDTSAIGFTLLLSLLTGVLSGLAPAWQAARQDARLTPGVGMRPGQRRLFNALVVSEIALTMVALLGAGLLVNSFLRLRRVEPGLDVERLLTVTFEPPSARYNGADWRAQRLNFWNQFSARVAALPGVEAVGAVDSLPFSGDARLWRFRREGDDANAAAGPAATFQVATPDYFRAVGMKLKRGRLFTSGDIENSPPVAVVNETMARRFWPGAEAVGRRIVIRNEPFAREIVGVVSDVKHFGLDREAQPEMYAPFEQFVIDVMPTVIRVSGDPASLAGAVREQARAVDPSVAVADIAPMRELLSDSLAQRRFTMLLLSVFATVATLLASAGVYGVMAYGVTSRAREIGVRLALGAQRGDVLWLVLKRGLKLASAGVAIGLLASLALTRLIKELLFGVSATDPLTFAVIAVLLIAVALLACWIPARRAAKVDPMVALREE
jgi:putative ABC transport system permease protein